MAPKLRTLKNQIAPKEEEEEEESNLSTVKDYDHDH